MKLDYTTYILLVSDTYSLHFGIPGGTTYKMVLHTLEYWWHKLKLHYHTTDLGEEIGGHIANRSIIPFWNHRSVEWALPAALFSSILPILCFWPPSAWFRALIWPFRCAGVKELHENGMLFIIVVTYQLILHIGEVWALQLHYFPQCCRFYVFDPPSAWFWALIWPFRCSGVK